MGGMQSLSGLATAKDMVLWLQCLADLWPTSFELFL